MDGDFLRDSEGKIVLDEDGFPVPLECGPFFGFRDASKGTLPVRRSPVTRTRTSLTSRFRRIGGGSPVGVLDSVKTWWGSLSKQWRWGIIGGVGVLAILTAALGKKEGKTKVGKV